MWCYTLFPVILNMSLTAGIAIVLVLLARLPLKKAPKVFSYVLWVVVLFRLLCPISFSTGLSLLGIFNSPAVTNSSITYIPTDIVHTANPKVDLPLPGISQIINETLPQGEEQTVADPLEAPMAVATFLWLFGIAVMLIYSIVSVLILKNRLKSARYTEQNIFEAGNLKTPFVFGIFRPRIFIPAGLTAEERGYIIRHEQTHIRRFDHIIKPFAFTVLSIHWFNPLVWIAFIFMSTDMELSCDERVIKEMGSDIKKAYSTSLLSLASGRRIINGSPLAFGEGDVKGRIKNVLNYKRPAFWMITAAVITVSAVGIGLISNPLSNAPSMKWAKSLRAMNVQNIELIVEPSLEHERYKQYKPGEYSEIVELINQSRGKQVKNPEKITGGAQTFYITTKDGVVHRFSNIGNVYLMIDGDAFEARYGWLNLWDYKGDSAVPDAFLEKAASNASVSEVGDAGLPAAINPSFTSIETDLIKLGTIAFDKYMSSLTSENTPLDERIASYKLNDISVLAGDISEFCVFLNYDFATGNESYVNPPRGVKGKGTWSDNYLEIRIRHVEGEKYEIVSIGTGGGGQGLEPYAPQQTTLEPASPELSLEQTVGVDMVELDYASDDIVIFHDYFGLFVYDQNMLEMVRSLDLKPLKCHQTQGDNYCEVSVSTDGNTVRLHPLSSKNMYVYTVSDNTLLETAYQPMEERFSSFVPIEDVIDSSEIGNYSHSAVKFDTYGYGYLHTTDGTIGKLSYVRDDMLYRLFGIKEN